MQGVLSCFLLVLAALLQPVAAQNPDFLGNASITGFIISIVMMTLMCGCCLYVCFLECGKKKQPKELSAA